MRPEVLDAIKRLRKMKVNLWSGPQEDLELVITELEQKTETWWHWLLRKVRGN